MAVYFDGSSYLECPVGAAYNTGTEWCVGMWVRLPTILQSDYTRPTMRVITAGNSSPPPNQFDWEIRLMAPFSTTWAGASHIQASDALTGFVIEPVNDEDGNIYAPYAAKHWQLYVLQQVNTGVSEWKHQLWAINSTQDPVMVGQSLYTDTVGYVFQSQGWFHIGNPAPALRVPFRGEMAELFVANGNLSRNKMLQLARGAKPADIPELELLRYYRMLTADTVGFDSSPNAGHASVFGTFGTTPHPIVDQVTAAQKIATWRFLVDWDQDRDTSDPLEDISEYVIDATWNVGFQEPDRNVAGDATLTLTLDNSDRRFSPENASGPYYGIDWAQRPIYVEANGVRMYSGWTTAIRPGFGNLTPTAALTARCIRQFFEQAIVEIQPLLTAVRSDEALQEIIEKVAVPWPTLTGPCVLDRVGYAELDSNARLGGSYFYQLLDVGEETFPYVGDLWPATLQVSNALQDIAAAERGKILVNRRGQLAFWSRRRLINTTDAAAVIDNTMQGYDYNWGDLLANEITLTCSPRVVSDTFTVLWTLDDPVKVNVGEEREITIKYGKEDADLIAALDVRVETFTSTPPNLLTYYFEPGATSARIIVRNSSYWPAEVTTIVVMGKRITGTNNFEIVLKNLWSQFRHGVSAKRIQSQLLGSADRAELAARYEIARFGEPVGNVRSLRLVSRDANTLTAILNAEPGARIRVSETQTQHTGDYFVVGERHRLTAATRLHEATWILEPCPPYTFWLLGVTGSSELGVTTRPAPL